MLNIYRSLALITVTFLIFDFNLIRTDVVKIKFASAEQIWEEMKKYIDANPYKYHKLESVWNEFSYQEYQASLSPKELQEEEAEAKKRSQQAKRFSRRPKDRHFYRNTNPFL